MPRSGFLSVAILPNADRNSRHLFTALAIAQSYQEMSLKIVVIGNLDELIAIEGLG
jgi:hypothetical protein